MLNKVRSFFTLTLIIVLSVSTLILSNPAKVEACPVAQTLTLLPLYLRSDVIFVADVVSEKDGEIVSYEEFFSVDIIKNLKISSVLKGKSGRNFSFTTTEVRLKTQPESLPEEETADVFPYDNRGDSTVKVGEKYLFFFKQDPKTKTYELTDYSSGYKKLTDPDLGVYEKRIKELEKIVGKKENQLEEITEWFVHCIEEPATRWDAISDLRGSFVSAEYISDDEESEEKEPFMLNEDFNENSPEIAENMSDSQKERISGIVYSSIQDEIFNNSFYGSLSSLAMKWDKPRLVTYAYSFLQTAETTDTQKTRLILEYIANISEDENLFNLAYTFPLDEEIVKTKVFVVEQKAETVSEPTTDVDESTKTDETDEQKQETSLEKTTEVEPEKKPKLTLDQKREKILQEFTSRYEYLLVRGFNAEDETEIAEK